MGKFNYTQNSFKAGELGPKLLGRSDTNEYQSACQELLNFVPMAQGGVTRRMGSEFAYASVSKPAIIPFVFSKDESYAILINHATSGSITVIDTKDNSLANVGSSTFEINGKSLDDWSWAVELDPNGWHHTQVGDIVILVHNSGTIPPITITRIVGLTDRSFCTISGHTTESACTTAGGFWVSLPAGGARFLVDWYNFPVVHFPEGANVNYTPPIERKLVLRFPYKPVNIIDDLAITCTAQTGNNYTFTSAKALWNSDEVGTFIRVIPKGSTVIEYVFRIITVNSANSAVLEIINTNFTTNPTLTDAGLNPMVSWKKSYWSDFDGWPKSVTSYEQRIFFGGSAQYPDSLWGSLAGNIFHMMKEKFSQDSGAENDNTLLNFYGDFSESDPMFILPASGEANRIQFLYGSDALVIGTIGNEYSLYPGDNGVLSQVNFNLIPQTNIGSFDVPPCGLYNSTFYIGRTGKKLQEFYIDPKDRVSQTTNLNVLNTSILSHNSDKIEKYNKITSQKATGTVWCMTEGDSLLSFTVDRATDIKAWSRHTIGGVDPKVKSIASIPNVNGSYDDIWLAVTRKGIGITMLRGFRPNATETPSVTDFGTEFIFVDYDPEGTFAIGSAGTPNYVWGGSAYRVIIKLPETITKGDLADKFFVINDGEESYAVWFDTTNGATAPTDTNFTNATNKIEVDIFDAESVEDIIKAIATKLNGSKNSSSDTAIYANNGYETIEKIIESFEDNSLLSTGDTLPVFSDCSYVKTSTTDTNSFTGFDVLSGDLVDVSADGLYLGQFLISNDGELNIAPRQAKRVIVGYNYVSRLKTFPLEIAGDFGSTLGVIQRIDKVVAILYKTFDIVVGYEDGKLEPLELIPSGALNSDFENGPPLFTGKADLYFPSSPEDEQFVIIEQNKPYPAFIIAIGMRGKTYDSSQ